MADKGKKRTPGDSDGSSAVLLYLGGGVLGALLGAVAAYVNARVLRRPGSSPQRFARRRT